MENTNFGKKLLRFLRDTSVLPRARIHPISSASSFSSKLAFNSLSRRKVGVSLHLRPRRRSLPGVCSLMTWQVQRAAWPLGARPPGYVTPPKTVRGTVDHAWTWERIESHRSLEQSPFPGTIGRKTDRAGTIDRWWLLA